MPATQQQIVGAAQAFHNAISQKLTGPAGLHAVTAIAASSRMAGTFMLRSFNLRLDHLAPGTIVLSEAANEKGMALVNVLAGTLAHFGTPVDMSQLRPVGDASEQPHLDLLGTQALLEHALSQIHKADGLSGDEPALAAAVCSAMFILDAATVVGVGEGFSRASLGFIEGLKTVPHRLDEPVSQPPRKPWYKRW